MFSIDRTFDGDRNSHTQGIIYITTGAGGKDLHDVADSDATASLLHPEDDNADYVAHFTSRYHSFTVIEIDGPSLQLTQIDELGRKFDHIHITKA